MLALVTVTAAFLMPLGWLETGWDRDGVGGWLDALPLDKLMHVLLLAGLAWLGLEAIVARKEGAFRQRRSACFALLAGLTLYAGLIEVLQQTVGHRSAEVADVLAGVLGLLGASLLWSRGATR